MAVVRASGDVKEVVVVLPNGQMSHPLPDDFDRAVAVIARLCEIIPVTGATWSVSDREAR